MKQSIGSGRGSVYNIIMKALQSGDKYGYEICQEVETKTNGNYILKQPSLYSGLKRLEAQKLVESYWGDSDIGGRRHYYKLTPAGRSKIEQTDFSWEDERNEIVDKFFEQSELDKSLNEVKDTVESITKTVEQSENINEQLNSIINNDDVSHVSPVQPKTNIKQQSSFSHKVNDNQFDLFSFANFANENQETSSNEIQNEQEELIQKEDVIIEEEKQTITSVEDTVENVFIENANTDEQLKVENIENKVEETTLNIEETIVKEQIECNEEPEDEINFEDFFINKKSNSFSEKVEEVSSTPLSLNDLEKSDTFYGSNLNNEPLEVSINDDFDKKYEQWANSLEDEKEEDLRLEQEKRMSDILSGNFTPTQNVELHKTYDSTIEKENTNIDNLDLQAIFGNNMEDTCVLNDTKEDKVNDKPEIVQQEELPRYDYLNNINLSLQHDKPLPKPVDDNYYGPFNELKPKEEVEQPKQFNYQTQKQFNSSVSFDKKCAEKYFNLSDYQIRYARKNNVENKPTDYTSINKLNLFSSCLILLVAAVMAFSLTAITINNFSSVYQVLGLVVGSLAFISFIIKQCFGYFVDKNKKIIFKFEKDFFITSLFLCTLLIVILFCLNMIFGMNFINILNYTGSFIIPCVYLVMVIIYPIIKLFLVKFSFFNK